MTNAVLAMFLYLGLSAFFGVISVAILSGASITTAVARGAVAMALFAALGCVAGLATHVRSKSEDANG